MAKYYNFFFVCNIFSAIYVLLICFNRKAFRFIQIKVATTFLNDVHFISNIKYVLVKNMNCGVVQLLFKELIK